LAVMKRSLNNARKVEGRLRAEVPMFETVKLARL